MFLSQFSNARDICSFSSSLLKDVFCLCHRIIIGFIEDRHLCDLEGYQPSFQSTRCPRKGGAFSCSVDRIAAPCRRCMSVVRSCGFKSRQIPCKQTIRFLEHCNSRRNTMLKKFLPHRKKEDEHHVAAIKLGDEVPNFHAESTIGGIDWHSFIDGSWAILFSHPSDYTPVCTTELGTVAALMPEFEKRGVKVAALSCNDVESHKGWIADIEAAKWCQGKKVSYPIIADQDREIVALYGMIDPDAKNSEGLPLSCRAVYVIGPDKTLKLSILYPATTGRNFNEVLRVIDSLQLTAVHSVATPVDWKHGDKCMVVPSLSDDAAKAKFGSFEVVPVPSEKPYIRMTADPSTK